MTPEAAKAAVMGFLRAAPEVARALVALEEPDGRGVELLELASGQRLRIGWGEVEAATVARSPLRPSPYLQVLLADGRSFALAEVGFAFAPSTRSSGPLPDLPAVACLRDLSRLRQGVLHELAHQGREPQALQALQLAIAVLDGARELGLSVGREEAALEQLLTQVEQHLRGG